MKATIEIHKSYGLTQQIFRDVISSAEYNPEVGETLLSLDRTSYEPVLVSGGFKELALRAQTDLGIDHAFCACEYFFDESGEITGQNLLPCDFEGKIDFIKLMLREYRLPPDAWIFVGDGKNDVPIAKRAPVSVAYAAHPALKDVSTYSIDRFGELAPIFQESLVTSSTY